MVDVNDIGERIETRADLGDDEEALYAYWMAQDAIAEKDDKQWMKKGRDIVKRYRDERSEQAQDLHRFNILWSNVQTLLPTLYGRTPKADCERRFKDNDPVARLAATILERCLTYSIDAFDFDNVMEQVVEDRLLPGRGVARVLYVPHFGDEIRQPQLESDDGTGEQDDTYEETEADASIVANEGDEEENADAEQLREVVFEEVKLTYVFWEDYREGAARDWEQVPWVRFRSYLTREELIKRFGDKKGRDVSLDYVPKGTPEMVKDDPPPDLYKKAVVWEIWDKTMCEVVWLAPGTPDIILDRRDDPLRLPDFFPNPDPLRSTSTTDKRIPVADYIEYQDQARELDKLTARIDKLTRALKVSGVYAGDEKQVLQQLIDEGTENRLIPVGDVPNWTDKGGVKGMIEWLPIEQIAQTLIQLHQARDKVKALLYELTGIGDIMRGMTEPDETLGAQRLKANFSTRRITPQQRKVGKFARNALRLMGAVVCEHFSAKTISLMSGFPQLDPLPPLPPKPQAPPPQPQLPAPVPQQGAAPPPGPQPNGGAAVPGGASMQSPAPPSPAQQAYQQQMAQWQQAAQAAQQVRASNQKKQQDFQAAVDLIKRDGVHGFRIDIEADSTVAIDEAEDQENRTEFLRQFIPMLQQVVPLAMGNPPLAGLAKEMTLFAMRGFRVARPLEESVTQAFDAIGKMPPPQQPGQQGGADSPADLAVRSKQVDADNNKTAAQLQIAREKNAIEMAKMGAEQQAEAAKLAGDQTRDRAQHSLDMAKFTDEAAFRRERASALESREAKGLS